MYECVLWIMLLADVSSISTSAHSVTLRISVHLAMLLSTPSSYRKYKVFRYRLPSSLSQRVDPVKTVSAPLRWAAGGAPKMKGLDRFMPRWLCDWRPRSPGSPKYESEPFVRSFQALINALDKSPVVTRVAHKSDLEGTGGGNFRLD